MRTPFIARWRPSLAALFPRGFRTKERQNPSLPEHLSAHMARDIGLSEDEYHKLTHRWPSETHKGH